MPSCKTKEVELLMSAVSELQSRHGSDVVAAVRKEKQRELKEGRALLEQCRLNHNEREASAAHNHSRLSGLLRLVAAPALGAKGPSKGPPKGLRWHQSIVNKMFAALQLQVQELITENTRILTSERRVKVVCRTGCKRDRFNPEF